MRSSPASTYVLAFLLGVALMMALGRRDAHPAEWSIHELLSRYSCKWVNEQRQFHTDAELEQIAKELKLPQAVIAAARRCKR